MTFYFVLEQHFIFFIVISTIIGSVFGSFICAAADRTARGLSIAKPRSHCVTCQKTIPLIDLIPFKVWIFNKGYCTNCKIRIPAETLVIEIIFAIGFSIIPFLAKNLSFCFGYVVLLLLTTYISLVDIKTLTIPKLSLELLFVFGLLLSGNQQRIPTAMEGLIFGLAITFIVFLFSKNGLGIGDVFLFGILGLFVGPIGLVPILVLAPAWGLCYTTFVKKQNPGAALIPFAPFLGMAGLFVYLFRLGD